MNSEKVTQTLTSSEGGEKYERLDRMNRRHQSEMKLQNLI